MTGQWVEFTCLTTHRLVTTAAKSCRRSTVAVATKMTPKWFLYRLVSIPKCRFRILTLLCLFAKQKGIRMDAFGIHPGREKIWADVPQRNNPYFFERI
eukprot:sb/3478881/